MTLCVVHQTLVSVTAANMRLRASSALLVIVAVAAMHVMCVAEEAKQAYYDDNHGIHWDNHPDEEDCPAPQPADGFVSDVFVAGNTFNWRDQPGVEVYPTTTPCCWQQKVAGKPVVEDPHEDLDIRRRVQRTKARTPSRKAPTPSRKARPAAVTDPRFQRPVSDQATGAGFLGTFDTTAKPTDQALLVAPHPTLKGFNYVVHAIKRKVAILIATEDGEYVGTAAPGALSFSTILGLTGIDPSLYFVTDPVGFYDLKEDRYVLVMLTYVSPYTNTPDNPPADPVLLVMVSTTNDPTGEWTVKGVQANLPESTGRYCSNSFWLTADYPQVTYDDCGVYLSIGTFCGEDGNEYYGSSLWAYPKGALYAQGDGPIKAAIYLSNGSFSASSGSTIDSFIQLAKPQTPADVQGNPLFAVNQGPSYMVVATLLGTHALADMTSAASAPRLQAKTVPFGFAFTGLVYPSLPQQQTVYLLDGGDMDSRVTAATKHDNTLYIATSKVYGSSDPTYVPAIYYAFLWLGPRASLCMINHHKVEGFLAAKQDRGKMGLSFPGIVGLPDGGALLTYAFSGAGNLPGKLGPAYAGVATTTVAPNGEAGIIEVVKVGEGVVETACSDGGDGYQYCRWGDYTGMSVVHGNRAWFSTSTAITAAQNTTWYGSWITSKPLHGYY